MKEVIGSPSRTKIHCDNTRLAYSSWTAWPEAKMGSLIVVREQPPSQYKVGDIITFMPPGEPSASVTHRIVRVMQVRGTVLIQTKGDANTSPDPWQLATTAILGKEVWQVPLLGYALVWLKSEVGFVVTVVGTFLLCVYGELRFLIRCYRPKRNTHLLSSIYP